MAAILSSFCSVVEHRHNLSSSLLPLCNFTLSQSVPSLSQINATYFEVQNRWLEFIQLYKSQQKLTEQSSSGIQVKASEELRSVSVAQCSASGLLQARTSQVFWIKRLQICTPRLRTEPRKHVCYSRKLRVAFEHHKTLRVPPLLNFSGSVHSS